MKKQWKARKIFTLLLTAILLAASLPIPALAAGATSITASVTVSDQGGLAVGKDAGSTAMANIPVSVPAGENGKSTVDAVLAQLHSEYCPDGYVTGTNSYDATGATKSITKVWGTETTKVGFYVNGTMPTTSVDTTSVSDGDAVDLIIYRSDFSDKYAYFDSRTRCVGTGNSFDLTLSYEYYDQNYTLNRSVLSGASVTANGAAVGTTDANGKISLSFGTAGTYLVSASGPDGTNITAPACVVTAVAPVHVSLSAQQGSGFLYPSKTLTVAYGTAAAYGFQNESAAGTITALDALVAAHADKYGDAFTSATASTYLSLSSGNPSGMFQNGNTTLYAGFAVNHSYAMSAAGVGYNANTAPLSDGDVVDFFYYEDPNWEDFLTWFADGAGNKLDTVRVEAGESFTLYLRGFLFISGDSNPAPAAVYNASAGKLQIYSAAADGTVGASLGSVTADTGAVAFSFASEGTYYLTARGTNKDGWRVVMPWCEIVVGAAGSITKNVAGSITVNALTPTPAFSGGIYSYTLPDQAYSKSAVGFKVAADSGASVTAVRNGGTPVTITQGAASWKNIALGAGTNNIAITVAPPSSLHALAKTYTFAVKRAVALKTLSLALSSGEAVKLGETFAPGTGSYTAAAPSGAALVITAAADGDAADTVLTVNDAAPAESYPIGLGDNIFHIKAASADGTQYADYTLTVTGKAAASAKITAPEGALVTVTDPSGNELALGTGETAAGVTVYTLQNLMAGELYSWHAGKYGFSARAGAFTASADDSDDVAVTLSAAAEPVSALKAEWPNFRNSSENMALEDIRTPRSAAEAQLDWQTSVRDGYSPVTCLMVGGKIVAVSGSKLFLINRETGAIEKQTAMADSRGYGYMPPVYGGGMLFVPLSGGKIQAFDAASLTSKWIYTDTLGGQALSAAVYDGGYLYTGFSSNSAAKSNHWVCIQTADENPASENEAKYATWTHTHPGGFYWSGAYISGDYLTVGADNSALLVLDKRTGVLTDSAAVDGDIRCSVAASGGKLYFVTKNGGFYTAAVGSSGRIASLTKVADIGGESTSTPVVVNGYAYVGVSNKTIAQVNLATGAVSAAATAAYSQSSLLASTAYSGRTYLYFTCNAKPGSLYVLEAVNATGAMTVSELYRPADGMQNYGVASALCGPDGTLYYTNDSGYLFAIGTRTPSGAPVSFNTVPEAAKVTLAGQTAVAGNSFDLPAGTYTYVVSCSGYETKTGSLTVSAEEAANHTARSVSAILTAAPQGGSGTITVSVKVKTHDKSVCGNAYTYKNNASAYFDIVSRTVTLSSGSTVLNALDAALREAGVTYAEKNPGYISEIGGIAEFDHGPNSGWQYMVNGSTATVGCRSYTLSTDAAVIWFYTDDYSKEYGSEAWGSAASGAAGTVIRQAASVSGNTASAAIPESSVAGAVQAAKDTGKNTITIIPTDTGSAGAIAVSISKASAKAVVQGGAALAVQTRQGNVTIPNDTLAQMIAAAAGDDLVITVTRGTAADAADIDTTNALIVKVTVTSGGKSITSFGGKSLTVDIPVDASYTAGALYKVIVLSADGSRETLSGLCVKKDGGLWVEVTVTHLSTFVVINTRVMRFADVGKKSWYYDAVAYVYDNGLMGGITAASFSPDAPMTRAMLVAALYRLEGSPAVTGTPAFADVAAGKYYVDAVAWAASSGIVNGTAAGTFSPDAPVTRQQAAAILYRYAQYKKYDVSVGEETNILSYGDAMTIGEYAIPAVQWACGAGVMEGTADGQLAPKRAASRAQAAVMLLRFCKYAVK